MYKLDHIDKKILEILQTNGKITNAKLAEMINLSPAPTLERVKKLEKAGLIKGYYAKIDERKLGYGIVAYMLVSVIRQEDRDEKSFYNRIKNLHEIVECHQITGPADYLIKLYLKDMEEFDMFVREKLTNMECVLQTQTMIVIKTYKENQPIILTDDSKTLDGVNSLKYD
jgi:DNA-binding Lrp family transcriptional regulator